MQANLAGTASKMTRLHDLVSSRVLDNREPETGALSVFYPLSCSIKVPSPGWSKRRIDHIPHEGESITEAVKNWAEESQLDQLGGVTFILDLKHLILAEKCRN